MKLYNALIKQDENNKIDDIALVEDSFSWMALLFNIPWFLYHKMWRNSLILIVANIVFIMAETIGLFSPSDLIFIETCFMILVAFNANYWYDLHLRNHKYQAIGFVLASNKIEARIKAMRILEHNFSDLSFALFSESMIDLGAYKKKQKNEPYFVS